MTPELLRALKDKADTLGLRRKPGDSSPPQANSPSLLQKAANFAKAATKHVLHGLPTVTDEEKERRLSICRGCEFYTEAGTCQKCGCAMKRKASWSLEHCPLRPPKW